MKEFPPYSCNTRFITLGEVNTYLRDIENPIGKQVYYVAYKGEIYNIRPYHNNQVWFESVSTDYLGAFLTPFAHMTDNGDGSYRWHYDYFEPKQIEKALDKRIKECQEKGWVKV